MCETDLQPTFPAISVNSDVDDLIVNKISLVF